MNFNDLPDPGPLGHHVGTADHAAIGENWHRIFLQFGLLPTDNILDIGCGIGRVAFALRHDCSEYVGLDIHDGCLTYCNDAVRPLLPSGSWFGQPGNMPIAPASRDLVISLSLFTHTDPMWTSRYIREALESLKPGGSFFFTFFDTDVAGHSNARQLFPHKYVTKFGDCRAQHPNWNTQNNVAYSFNMTLQPCLSIMGFQLDTLVHGHWSGRHPRRDPFLYQDFIIARKP